MKIKAVLFDLDGTLLPMDQSVFVKAYFGSLAKRLASRGYEPNKLIESIWLGSYAMVKNDGAKTNEEVFWDKFREIYGDRIDGDMPYFEEFYVNEFDNVRNVCGFNPDSKDCIYATKDMGLRVALATNPIFPAIATQKRVSWCGLDVSDFELYTTYENSHFSKPNLNYYKEVLSKMQLSPTEVLMVGNDVTEDMVAEQLGMQVFLVTDDIINKENKDISSYPSGNLKDFLSYVSKIQKQ